jgi:hypothetical protein
MSVPGSRISEYMIQTAKKWMFDVRNFIAIASLTQLPPPTPVLMPAYLPVVRREYQLSNWQQKNRKAEKDFGDSHLRW